MVNREVGLMHWFTGRKYLIVNCLYLIGIMLLCGILLKKSRFELFFGTLLGDAWFLYPMLFWTLITFFLVSGVLLLYGLLVDPMILDKRVRFIKPENWRQLFYELGQLKKELALACVYVLLLLGCQVLLTYLLTLFLPFGFIEIMFFQLVMIIPFFFPRAAGMQKIEQSQINPMTISSFIYLIIFISLTVQHYGG